MFTKKYKLIALAFWREESNYNYEESGDCGTTGGIGVVLGDSTPVRLCGVEKWDLGVTDSLRKGWKGNIKICKSPKPFYFQHSESELKYNNNFRGIATDALWKNTPMELTVPEQLKSL